MKKKRASKIRALILVAALVVGVIPINAFANELTRKNVVNVNTSTLSTSMNVEVGTAREKLELPSEFEVQVENEVQNEEGVTETTTDTEMAKVNWTGEYDSAKVGDYTFTAAFESPVYHYTGTMPSVTVHVIDNGENVPKPMVLAQTPARAPANVPAEPGQQINLVDINKITSSLFRVKPAGSSEWKELPLPSGTVVHVGDEVHIKFKYSQLTEVQPNNVYYFDIPNGLSAITGESRGDIKSDDGRVIGSFWVEDGKVKMQFTNEEFLQETENIIEEGFVNFYATLNQDAVTQDGEIKLGQTVIGKVPIVPDENITNLHVKKYNGTPDDGEDGLAYDPATNTVKYTIKIDTNGNNKTLEKVDVKDVLATTVNGSVDNSIVAGD